MDGDIVLTSDRCRKSQIPEVKKSVKILLLLEAQMIREKGIPILEAKCADKMLLKFPVGMPKFFYQKFKIRFYNTSDVFLFDSPTRVSRKKHQHTLYFIYCNNVTINFYGKDQRHIMMTLKTYIRLEILGLGKASFIEALILVRV